MRYRIRIRCMELGIKSKELMKMVSERTGEKLESSSWSSFINGNIITPKAERCVEAANEILTELEAARK